MWTAYLRPGRCARKVLAAAESCRVHSYVRLYCASRAVASTSRRWGLMVGQRKTWRLCPWPLWSGFWVEFVDLEDQSWGACCGRHGQAVPVWCRAALDSGRAQQTSSYELLGAAGGGVEGVVQAASCRY
jgi:hypothetical protein